MNTYCSILLAESPMELVQKHQRKPFKKVKIARNLESKPYLIGQVAFFFCMCVFHITKEKHSLWREMFFNLKLRNCIAGLQ